MPGELPMTNDDLQVKTTSAGSLLERMFVAVVLILVIVVPPIWWEAFPLTANPMFARSMHERRSYSLFDAEGHRLNNDLYGLRTNINWYLEDFYAVKYPETVVPPLDQPPDVDKVLNHVRRVGYQQGAKFPLKLECRVFGPVDDSAIGIISHQSWTIPSNSRD